MSGGIDLRAHDYLRGPLSASQAKWRFPGPVSRRKSPVVTVPKSAAIVARQRQVQPPMRGSVALALFYGWRRT